MRGRMESCNPTSVLWNPALDDDPGFGGSAHDASHARPGAPTHEPPTDAFLVSILGEHGFDEVPA